MDMSSHSSLDEIPAKWYAVSTLVNYEDRVKEYLDRLIQSEGLGDYILEVLVPSKVVVEFRNRKKVQQVNKFYPGYVFLKMRLYDEHGRLFQRAWELVRGTAGVSSFLGKNRPQAISEKEIDTILKSVKNHEGKPSPRVDFLPGDKVRINDGIFKSSDGSVDFVDAEQGRVRVSVQLFGRLTPVELECWQIEKIKNI